jgi:hypothetical protein
MMLAGFRRCASAMRRRNWPSFQRDPAPERSGREVALEALFGNRAGVAQQAQALLAIRDDGAAACRVAGRGRQRLRDCIADDLQGRRCCAKLDQGAIIITPAAMAPCQFMPS